MGWEITSLLFLKKRWSLSTKDLHVYYGTNESIKGVDMQFEKNKITALIGPSGSGNQLTYVVLNRMNDTIDIARVTGWNLVWRNRMSIVQISMFMKCASTLGWFSNGPILLPNRFIKHHLPAWTLGWKTRRFLGRIGRNFFETGALWDQVKDDLHKSALTLSGGQQQRLCIARAISISQIIPYSWMSQLQRLIRSR